MSAYFYEVGPINVRRPVIAVSPPAVQFPMVTVGDTVNASVTVSNPEEEARFELVVGDEKFVESRRAGLAGIPLQTVLLQNRPNPFRRGTLIRYELSAGGGQAAIRFFDVRGRLVRTLGQGPARPGRYELIWDGRDEQNAGSLLGSISTGSMHRPSARPASWSSWNELFTPASTAGPGAHTAGFARAD